jgi:hypothetical protein
MNDIELLLTTVRAISKAVEDLSGVVEGIPRRMTTALDALRTEVRVSLDASLDQHRQDVAGLRKAMETLQEDQGSISLSLQSVRDSGASRVEEAVVQLSSVIADNRVIAEQGIAAVRQDCDLFNLNSQVKTLTDGLEANVQALGAIEPRLREQLDGLTRSVAEDFGAVRSEVETGLAAVSKTIDSTALTLQGMIERSAQDLESNLTTAAREQGALVDGRLDKAEEALSQCITREVAQTAITESIGELRAEISTTTEAISQNIREQADGVRALKESMVGRASNFNSAVEALNQKTGEAIGAAVESIAAVSKTVGELAASTEASLKTFNDAQAGVSKDVSGLRDVVADLREAVTEQSKTALERVQLVEGTVEQALQTIAKDRSEATIQLTEAVEASGEAKAASAEAVRQAAAAVEAVTVARGELQSSVASIEASVSDGFAKKEDAIATALGGIAVLVAAAAEQPAADAAEAKSAATAALEQVTAARGELQLGITNVGERIAKQDESIAATAGGTAEQVTAIEQVAQEAAKDATAARELAKSVMEQASSAFAQASTTLENVGARIAKQDDAIAAMAVSSAADIEAIQQVVRESGENAASARELAQSTLETTSATYLEVKASVTGVEDAVTKHLAKQDATIAGAVESVAATSASVKEALAKSAEHTAETRGYGRDDVGAGVGQAAGNHVEHQRNRNHRVRGSGNARQGHRRTLHQFGQGTGRPRHGGQLHNRRQDYRRGYGTARRGPHRYQRCA